MIKSILSLAVAVVVAFIVVSLVLFAFKISFLFISMFKSLILLGLIAVFAVPLYIVARKKLFN